MILGIDYQFSLVIIINNFNMRGFLYSKIIANIYLKGKLLNTRQFFGALQLEEEKAELSNSLQEKIPECPVKTTLHLTK